MFKCYCIVFLLLFYTWCKALWVALLLTWTMKVNWPCLNITFKGIQISKVLIHWLLEGYASYKSNSKMAQCDTSHSTHMIYCCMGHIQQIWKALTNTVTLPIGASDWKMLICVFLKHQNKRHTGALSNKVIWLQEINQKQWLCKVSSVGTG